MLFYRRRSSGPLGGERFVNVAKKYEDEEEDEEVEDEEATKSDGGRLGGASTGERGITTTTVAPVSGPDDDDDDDDILPSYDSVANDIVRPSIEGDNGSVRRKSLDMTQNWSFESLKAGEDQNEGYASNDADLNSTDDERNANPIFYVDQDDSEMTGNETSQFEHVEAPPAPDNNAQVALSDIQNETWARKGVISVPAPGSDGSREVAEIHVEESGSKTT